MKWLGRELLNGTLIAGGILSAAIGLKGFLLSRTLDFVLYGLEEFTAITIVSARSAAIRERITGELERGVTVFKGYGGLTGAEQDILFCVVTRLEIGKVKAIVRAEDAAAFVVSHALAGAEAASFSAGRCTSNGSRRPRRATRFVDRESARSAPQ